MFRFGQLGFFSRKRSPLVPAGPQGLILPVKDAAGAYLAEEMVTATPQRLGLMLYDRTACLCRQAIDALDEGQADYCGELLAKARQIIQHLSASLGRQLAGSSAPLRAMFDEAQRSLIEADFYRRRRAIEQAVNLLAGYRQSWQRALSGSCPDDGARGPRLSSASWVG